MRALWLVVRAQLLRRPGTNLLVACALALAATLGVAALLLLRGVDRPFERMVEEQRASHLLLRFDARLYSSRALADWWRGQPHVLGVGPPLATLHLSESPSHRGRELSTQVFVVEHAGAEPAQDRLRVVEGAAAPQPGPGEVWIPTALAQAEGLAIGDVLELPASAGAVPLLISAVVVDPQFSNVFINPTRLWVAAGSLPLHFAVGALDQVMLGVRLDDPAQLEPLWQAFCAAHGGGFSGSVLRHEMIRAAHLGFAGFLAAALVLLAVLALLAGLLVLSSTLSAAMQADRRLMGVLRAQGVTPGGVVGLYALQFVALLGVALLPGLALGAVVGRLALQQVLRALAVPALDAPVLGSCGIVAVALGLCVLLWVTWLARRAAAEAPATALYGDAPSPSTRVTAAPAALLRLPVPAWLAAIQLRLQPARSLSSALCVAATVFAVLSTLTLVASFDGMRSDLSRWGFDRAEVRVFRSGRRASVEHAALVQQLRDDAAVRAVLPLANLVEGTVPAGAGHGPLDLYGTVADGAWETAGFRCEQGHPPQAPDEIALAAQTARTLGAGPGDAVELLLEGQRQRYRVAGIYQSVQNMGQGFRLPWAALRRLNPLRQPTEYALMLQPGVEREGFIARLEAELGEAVDAQPGERLVASVVDAIVRALTAALGLVSLIFVGVAMVALFNQTVLDAREQRRSLGILKVLGLTPRQLRAALALKAVLLGAIGALVGALAWAASIQPVLDVAFARLGLLHFPLAVAGVASLGASLAVVLLGGAAAWLASRAVSHLSARDLITE